MDRKGGPVPPQDVVPETSATPFHPVPAAEAAATTITATATTTARAPRSPGVVVATAISVTEAPAAMDSPIQDPPSKGRWGRRLSLDIASLLKAKKRSPTSGLPPSLPPPPEHRSSFSAASPSSTVLGAVEGAPSSSSSSSSGSSGFPFLWRRTRRGSDHEAFIVVHYREGFTSVVRVEDDTELKRLVELARMERKEERVSSYRVIVASAAATRTLLHHHHHHHHHQHQHQPHHHPRNLSSSSSPDCCSPPHHPSLHASQESLLRQMQLHLQAVAEHSANTDDRLVVVTELLQTEQQYFDSLQMLYEQYAEPLRKFSSLSVEDHVKLFVGLEPVFKQSAALIEKLHSAVNNWDRDTTTIGELFPNRFWKTYADYYDTYGGARQFLEERLSSDKALEEFCDLRQQHGILPLHSLLCLPVKRIPEYDKYLNDLLDDTDQAHPDYEELAKAANKVRTMVKEREEEDREAEQEERMELIQDRFPFDDLQLTDRAQTSKSRGVSGRRKSAPSAVVFRSISGGRSRSSSVLWPQNTMGRKDDALFTIKQAADSSRSFSMEEPVQFSMGMQTQDRYLFLLSDLLLVAKQKNSATFKLKIRVPLCDVWLSSCVDEVTELTRPLDKSFVIGWPTYNVVATFRDTLTKDRWLTKLTELIHEQKQQLEPKEITLKVFLRDQNKTCELTVKNTQQAKDVLHDCFTQFNIPDSESKDYKLWVCSGKEGYYPLIGHEIPFSIHVSHLREVGRTRGEEGMTLEELNQLAGHQPSNCRCQFILRHKKTPKKHSLEETTHKSMKKSKKSSPLLNIFKRTGREDKTSDTTPIPVGKLFGLPLASVCQPDDSPPKPIAEFLAVLYRDGPTFLGILRKNANAKFSKELRFRLDQGEQVTDVPAVVAGGLIKDYLRSLPEPLLLERLHDDWLQVASMTEEEEKVQHIKQLLSQLPSCNLALLKRLLCALHSIQLQHEENKMNSFNLSLCIAPSLLWHKEHLDLSGAAPAVEFMIDHCAGLFGPEVLQLLQDPKSRPDSGTDSDSYHSVLSIPETGNSDSIDSLVDRELFTAEGEGEGEEEEEGESCPQVTKSHLSPSNLSRDSGLTLSDTQLYDDDCAEHPHDPRLAFRPAHHHHRPPMHYADRDDDESDSYHLDPPLKPVAPPRKKGKRQGTGGNGGHAGRMDSGGGAGGGGIRGRDKRHTLHASLSSSRLLDHLVEDSLSSSSTATIDSLRSTRTLPSFSTMADMYSQGAVLDRDELREYNPPSDIGMLRKSASGAHLILDEESVSRKCSETSLGGSMVFRQTSGVDSTPPHSPQSKYSYSSRDSVISDSSHGLVSRESSITSAPQTPDTEYADRLPPWLPYVELDGVRDRRLAHSLNLPHVSAVGEEEAALSASASASQLRSEQDLVYLQTPPESLPSEADSQDFMPLSFDASSLDLSLQASSSLPWQGRSREAEDITSGSSPQIHITPCSSRSVEKLDQQELEEATPRSSPSSSADMLPLEIAHDRGHGGLPMKQMSKYSHNLAKVSPPPRVLLQSLRSPRNRKDPAPVRASHDSDIVAQVQRAGFNTPREEEGGEGEVEAESNSSLDADDTVSSEGAVGFSAHNFDAAQSMDDAINDREYIPVKPKLTIIRREESILSTTSSHSSASSVSSSTSTGMSSLSSLTLSTSPSTRSSSSSGSSSNTLAGEQTRPSRPPEYAEAVQRSLLLKQEAPLDAEAQAQIEASRKAKSLFENSMQKYLQDRQEQGYPRHGSVTRKISDPGTTRGAGVIGGHGRPGADLRRSASPDLSSSPLIENLSDSVHNHRVSSKHPRQIYLESLQRYEQQQTGSEDGGSVASRTTETVPSSGVKGEADAQSPAKQESAAADRTRPVPVHVSETRVQLRAGGASANRTHVPKDARPRSMLDVPFSSLHRSYSDSADRLNKMGLRSPQGETEVRDGDRLAVPRPVNSAFRAVEQGKPQSPGRKTSDTAIYEGRNGSGPSASRHAFQTASYFYHPDDSPRSGRSSSPCSPRVPSPRPDTGTSRTPKTDNGVGQYVGRTSTRPPRSESPVPRPSREVTATVTHSTQPPASVAGSAEQSGSRTAPDASEAASSSASDRKSRSQLGWSVKNLAKMYSADSNPGCEQSSRNPPRNSSQASSAVRAGPPPYQDPPPFRRLQDKSRLSTSSSSSNASSSTGRSGSPTPRVSTSASWTRKDGPQSAAAESQVGEDITYPSPMKSRARSVEGRGVSDQEATNPYTDISYV